MAHQAAQGVQFHHGYGEFTAKDVVHNHALWCDEKYPGRKDTPYAAYKNGICQVERVEVVNDHEIVMHCKVVCLDLLFYYSSASTVVIFSKAQWDKEGEMAYETKPAGTGPYIFKERQPDRYVLYERAPTPHWKWGVVDWKELADDLDDSKSRRALAQFVAGETHITEINKDLVEEAVRKGHKLIRSRQVAQQVVLVFGGSTSALRTNKRSAIPKTVGPRGNSTPSVPWTKRGAAGHQQGHQPRGAAQGAV